MDKKRALKVIDLAATVKELRTLLKNASSVALNAAEDANLSCSSCGPVQGESTDCFVQMHYQLVKMGEDVAEVFGKVVSAQATQAAQVGQLYRRKQGRNFWGDNTDGGLPQGNPASGNDPVVFTIEPSGKLLLARLQRSCFGPMPYSRVRLDDTYFVWPEDIEVVS